MRHAAGVMLLVCAGLAAGFAHAPTAAAASPDLAVTAVATPDPAVIAGRLTLIVTVRNTGDGVATDAGVNLLFIRGGTVFSSPGCTTFVDLFVMCGVTLAPGATATRRIAFNDLKLGEFNVTVQSKLADPLVDPTPDDDVVALATRVNARPDLRLTITNPTGTIAQGASATISVEVLNAGRGPAPDVQLRLVLPDGLPPGELPAGCSSQATLVTCGLGVIRGGSIEQWSFTFGNLPAGNQTVLVSVRADLGDGDVVQDQGQASLLVAEVAAPDPVQLSVIQASTRTLVSGGPASGGCVAGRRLSLKVRPVAGSMPVTVQFYVNRRQVRHVSGAALQRPVVLKNLPGKRFTLKVLSTFEQGNRASGDRPLRPCVARRR